MLVASQVTCAVDGRMERIAKAAVKQFRDYILSIYHILKLVFDV